MSAGSVGTMSNGNSYSWSMGETFTTTLPSSTLTFTQGFQQLFNVLGCTDPTAFNYNANANQDNGSCIPMLTCNVTALQNTMCQGEANELYLNTTGGGALYFDLPTGLQTGWNDYYAVNGNLNNYRNTAVNANNVGALNYGMDRFGINDRTLSVNGNQGATINTGAWNLNQDYTICFWMKWDGVNTASQTLFSTGSMNDGGINIKLRPGMPGPWSFYTGSGSAASNAPAPDTEWHYFTAKRAGTWFYLLVDGVEVGSSNYLESTTLTSNNGSGSWGVDLNAANGFSGDLDDFQFWSRALTQEELTYLYSSAGTKTILWSTNETQDTINVSPDATTSYSCTVQSGSQTCTSTLEIEVNPLSSSELTATIIEGESYNLGTQTLTTSGVYDEVFTGINGCDSTVTLYLTVEPLLSCNISAPTTTLCAGESVLLSMNTTGGIGALTELPLNLQDGLVAYYPFNGNANDESGNGNDGTVNGATLTVDRFGNANGAYSFTSLPSSINTTATPILSGNSRTYSLWLMPQSALTINQEIVVLQAGGNGSMFTGFSLVLFQSSNPSLIDVGLDLGASFVRWGSAIEAGVWNHVAIEYSDAFGPYVTNCRLFINGSEITTISGSFNPTAEINTISGSDVILAVGGDINQQFFGQLDDVSLFSRILTMTEIQQLYTVQSYNWSNGGTAATNVVSPTSNTTYTCTVTQGAQACTASVDVTVNPLITFFTDADGDGFGDLNTPQSACVQPAGTVTNSTDCNDNDASLNSVSSETCNNFDDDCDGNVDNGLNFVNYYNDADGDGYGTGIATNLCSNPGAGYVTTDGDCDDTNNTISPGATEICNILDDDCDTQIDEDLPLFTWYVDNDGDGIGTGNYTESCAFLSGYATIGGDCNDNDATISPVANEICNNVDENCDGVLNDGLWIAAYIDADGDGYGDYGISVDGLCELTTGYVGNNQDCDDSNPAIYSSASEICDGLDNNCNGQIDDGLPFTNYFIDMDGDGYGAGNVYMLCSNPGPGYVTNNTDCNDNDAAFNPGISEICGNNIDENCNGADLPCYTTGTPGAPIPVPGITQYGTGVQSNISFDLAGGGNSIESPGSGNDRWYQFTAATNAARIGLRGSTAVNDDNRLLLFEGGQTLGQELIPLDTEDAVSPGNTGISNDGGNETILYDQLNVGSTYLVCIQNTNNAPGTIQISVGFLYGSATDIGPYTQYTNTYNNTCQNFKCKFKPNGKYYTIHRWNNANDDINGTPAWSYAIPSLSSTICQLGRITPPNFSGQVQNLHVTVDVQYQLPNAYGTIENLNAKGIVMGNFNLNNEAPLTVRASDACPNYKSPLYGSVATNRSVCGAAQYQWEWTMVLPNAGLPINVNGSLGGSRTLGITQVTGIDMGQKYDVRIRVKHFDQVSITPYSTVSCVRTLGSAGMTPYAEEELLSHDAQRGEYVIAPNPSLNDEIQVSWKEVQEGMVPMVLQDMTGKTVWKSIENVSGTIHHITLPQLAAGVYMMVVDQQPVRLVVQ